MRVYTEDVNDPCGGLKGYMMNDVVTVGLEDDSLDQNRDFKPRNYLFGCTENEPRLFREQYVNGIIGFMSKSNDGSHAPNLVDIFLNSGEIKQDSF